MLDHIEARSIIGGNECGPHQAGSGLDWKRDLELAVGSRGHSSVCPHSAVDPGINSFAVDAQFELFVGNVGTHTHITDRKGVLAIGWEYVGDGHSATGAERHSLDLHVLRTVGPFDVQAFGRCIPESHRHPRDLGRRSHIGLNQRRRYRQRTGNVVETAARIV